MAKFRKSYSVPELENKLEDELSGILSPEEKSYVLKKKNRATQIIGLQSKDLKELLNKGLIDNFRHITIDNMLADLYIQQGQCERFKRFPYPRQFTTFSLYFVWLFILLVPLGMLQEFEKMGDLFICELQKC